MYLSKLRLKILDGLIRRQFKTFAAAAAKDQNADDKIIRAAQKGEKKEDISVKSNKSAKVGKKDLKKAEKDVEKVGKEIRKETQIAAVKAKNARKVDGYDSKKTKVALKAAEIDKDIKKETHKIDKAVKKVEKAVKKVEKDAQKSIKKIDEKVDNDVSKNANKDEQDLKSVKQVETVAKKELSKAEKEVNEVEDKAKKSEQNIKKEAEAVDKEAQALQKQEDQKKSKEKSDTDKDDKPPCSKFDGKLVGTCKITKFSNNLECGRLIDCPKIAILGAGISGLSAAWRLQQVGLNNYTIFEANKRVGGRIYSAWCGEGINEYGAEWIHGETNPILQLAHQEGLTICKDKDKCDIYMNQCGQPVNANFVEESKTNWKKIIDEGVKTYCNNEEDAFIDFSLQDFIKKQQSKLKWRNESAKELFESMSFGGSCNLGGPSNQLSLNDLGAKFRYETKYGIREGMIAILAPILKDLPEDVIKCERKVQIIQWDDDPVRLIFDDCSEQCFDMVIVTFSLGVLKNDVELFEPELPADKLDAIEKTGFAPINKIFLDYAEPFWLKGEGKIFISRKIDHNSTNWEDAIYKIQEICGGRNTLEISLCGQPAIDLEEHYEEEIAEKITLLLRKFTGVHTTPFPMALSKTCWANNPLFMGSVSFMGKSTNQRHLRTLGLPVPLLSAVPKILFAGDYTGCGEIGTLKGARISGFREAQRIINTVCHLGWPPKQRCHVPMLS